MQTSQVISTRCVNAFNSFDIAIFSYVSKEIDVDSNFNRCGQGRMKWRNCRMALLCYVTGKVGRILIQNENCVYGYQAACTQPKQPNEFGSFGGQSTVPPLHSSLQQCIDTPLGLGSYLQINFFKSVIKLPEKLKINLFFLKETIR